MKHVWHYTFPRVGLGICEEDGFITDVFFAREAGGNPWQMEETASIKRAAEQLDEYFMGKRTFFDFPILPSGTVFQKKVWDAVSAIPYGETRTYKEIAIQTGSHLAARAVGMANNRNPIAIVIPCHRVIGHNGSLVGYGGGLDVKAYLLELEKRVDTKLMGITDIENYGGGLLNKKKLLKRIYGNNKNVKFNDFIIIVESFGFFHTRSDGSHFIYKNNQINEWINLQNKNGEAKPYQIKQFLSLVEKYNLEMEE